MNEYECISIERRDGYAILTLNRPDKRNAVNIQLQTELRHALASLTDNAKSIVLTGEGPAFCAGVDLNEARDRKASGIERPTMGEIWFETLEQVRRHPAVFIAAVNGFALGGGLTLVNVCDLAVASTTATFGMPELGFGEFPGLAGATTLHRIQPKHVAEMILTADRFDAETAYRFGLVNRISEPAALLDEAVALAQRVARHDPMTLRVSKRAIWELKAHSWSQAIEKGMWMSTLSRGESAP